jgi:hypothetical protein
MLKKKGELRLDVPVVVLSDSREEINHIVEND